MLEEAEWTPPDEFDEYRIVRELGRGSMGSVYLARDVVLDRPVAMKFLGALRPDPAERERFLVEARAIARIQHPNVMSIFRVGEVKGRLYLVTEYIRGQNLADLKLPLPWTEVLEIGIGLARALAAAHRQGVLHRDIKLSNAVIEEGAQ
ncbi:MAG TPA: protein kinase, partial [Nannocystis exedens]|nr:protein kinase [Nannocystis exedens]